MKEGLKQSEFASVVDNELKATTSHIFIHFTSPAPNPKIKWLGGADYLFVLFASRL